MCNYFLNLKMNIPPRDNKWRTMKLSLVSLVDR